MGALPVRSTSAADKRAVASSFPSRMVAKQYNHRRGVDFFAPPPAPYTAAVTCIRSPRAPVILAADFEEPRLLRPLLPPFPSVGASVAPDSATRPGAALRMRAGVRDRRLA